MFVPNNQPTGATITLIPYDSETQRVSTAIKILVCFNR
jgi:hypothetical protein